MLPSRLLFIADYNEAGKDFFPVLNAALKGGARWVMLRAKHTPPHARREVARRVKELCDFYNATLTIHGDGAAADYVGARGLHLSSSSRVSPVAGLLMGRSCHNAAELGRAVREGADYALFSPLFLTPSKPDYGPVVGLLKLQALAGRTPMPLVALGGITPANAPLCLNAGAAGIAVMGGILFSRNPEAKTKAYLAKLG